MKSPAPALGTDIAMREVASRTIHPTKIGT